MRILWAGLFLLQALPGHGQSAMEMNSIKKGDHFQKETVVNSNMLIQHGGNSLVVGTRSFISELYSVVDASSSGFIFKVTTLNILDTVRSSGEEEYYNSASFTDHNSAIQQAIQGLMNRTLFLKVDSIGFVVSVDDNNTRQPDSLVTILGLFPNKPIRGEPSNFLTGYNFSTLHGNGFTIADSSARNNRKTVTNYSISFQTDTTTTITFSQRITDSLANTNTNGFFVVNNYSGLIMERTTKSITAEEQLFNEVNYSIIRKTAIKERYKKIE